MIVSAGRNRSAASGGGQSWLISFADLLSIMLVFMVLLFSMNAVPADKWEEFLISLKTTDNPAEAALSRRPLPVSFRNGALQPKAIGLSYLGSVFEQKLDRDRFLGEATVERHAGKLVIGIPAQSLFAGGSPELKKEARQKLFDIAGNIGLIGNGIAVAAHTGEAQPGDPEYAGNFELSLQRAIAIAEILKQSGYMRDIAVYGLADAQSALGAYRSPDKLYAPAERIEIVISAYPAGDEPWL